MVTSNLSNTTSKSTADQIDELIKQHVSSELDQRGVERYSREAICFADLQEEFEDIQYLSEESKEAFIEFITRSHEWYLKYTKPNLHLVEIEIIASALKNLLIESMEF